MTLPKCRCTAEQYHLYHGLGFSFAHPAFILLLLFFYFLYFYIEKHRRPYFVGALYKFARLIN